MAAGDRLEREEQIETGPVLNPQDYIMSSPETATGGIMTLDEAMTPDALPQETQALIWRCMEGVEPLERELEDGEVQKLNTVHVNAILLSAAGIRNRVIAQQLGYHQIYVAKLMRHPYSIKIKTSLFAFKSAKVIDIKTRLDEMAEDLMEHTYDQALRSNDLKAISRVTFGMLDRAGYGPTSTVKNEPATPAAATGTHLARLAQALEASERVDAQVMPGRSPSVPPHEGIEDQASEPVQVPVSVRQAS